MVEDLTDKSGGLVKVVLKGTPGLLVSLFEWVLLMTRFLFALLPTNILPDHSLF